MIWIVTDHQPTKDALSSLITARGYDVLNVNCGDSVRKRIRFATPVLVILDCGFPDSFDMLSIIRVEERERRIPVVMYGDLDPGLQDKSILKGASAFVVKSSLDWEPLFQEIIRFAGRPPEN